MNPIRKCVKLREKSGHGRSLIRPENQPSSLATRELDGHTRLAGDLLRVRHTQDARVRKLLMQSLAAVWYWPPKLLSRTA